MDLPFGWLARGLGGGLSSGVVGTIKETAQSLDINLKALDPPESEDDTPAWDAIMGGISQLGGIVGSPLGLLPALMSIYMAGRGQEHSQSVQRFYKPSRIPPEVYTKLLHRGYISPEDEPAWIKDLHDQGWSKDRVDAITESYRVLLSTGEIRELYLRGKLGKGDEAKAEAIARMSQHGISPDDATKLFDIFFFIPPVQDLVTWSAKEVFEPDMIKKYGLDDEFEALDLSLFAQAGVSPEQARNYWRAHWQHPGLNTIQELLHRTDFTEADFWEWFKLVEIPPFWREKLIKIAYSPFTRVDIRRMYREGILNETEVNTAYHEIGYDDWHADKLSAWTVKYYAPEDTGEDKEVRELTKAEILRGYEDKIIGRQSAIDGLKSLDYSEYTAEFLVILRDVKVAEAETKEALTYIGNAYKVGILTDSVMIDKLGELDLTGEQSDYYIAKWRKVDTQKTAVPSKADFKRWLKLEIVTVADFRSYLDKAGFIAEHIEYYVKEVGITELEASENGD